MSDAQSTTLESPCEIEAFGHECTLCDHPAHAHYLLADATVFGPYRCHFESCDCMSFATTELQELTEQECDARWPNLVDHLRKPDVDAA